MIRNLCNLLDECDLTLVTSQPQVFDWARERNLSIVMIDTLDSLPRSVLDLCHSIEHKEKIASLLKRSAPIKLVSIPQIAFDSSPAAMIYSCERLLAADSVGCVKEQARLLQLFGRAHRISLTGNASSGVCNFFGELEISAFAGELFPLGMACSAAQLFEVSLDVHDTTVTPAFEVTGIFKMSGLLMARAPDFHGKPYSVNEISSLVGMVAEAGHAEVHLKNNTISRVIVDGRDIALVLQAMTGKRGLTLTEFAIGLNKRIRSDIDWRVNSQLNEGVEGIHLGIGDGRSGLHIDLLCPTVRCAFDTEADVPALPCI